jgi:hypothetical protein
MKPQNTTLKTRFATKKGIGSLGKFLINTEIATRKLILEDMNEEVDEHTTNE